MSRRFPLFLLRCAFPLILPGLFPEALAQNDLSIPDGSASATANASAVQSADSPASPSAVPPVPPVKPAATNEPSEQWEQELLRDPFWPVGFSPDGWQKKESIQSNPDREASGWKAASGEIRISGTSRLGERAAAIINGELKSTGDHVEVLFEGKTYQWQVVGIDADGRVQLKKLGIR